MRKIVTAENIFIRSENVYMWCPKMARHIAVKEKNKYRIFYLVAMNQLSSRRRGR